MAGRQPCCNAVGPLEMLMRESLALRHGSYIVAESTTFAMSAFPPSIHNFTPEQLVDFLGHCKHEAFIMREVCWNGITKEIPPVIVLANDDDGYYTQVFRNRSELNAFIDQLRSTANELWPAEDAFRSWWDNEGSGMPPEPDEETSAHAERIAKIAWANGAYTGCGVAESTIPAPTHGALS